MKSFHTAPVVLVLLLPALAACAQGPAAAAPEPFHATYTVRGRWPGDRVISYRILSGGGPTHADTFHGAVETALATWESTRWVRFRAAISGEEPDDVFAWRRGPHESAGDCTALGDPCIEHAGPVGPGTYVHFDADQDWSRWTALRQAAIHEVGHVLGLDHTDDPESVMNPDPEVRRAWLGRTDHAAIRALYGKDLEPRDGDMVVRDALGRVQLVIPMIAPGSLTAWTLGDVDADGYDELLVRRTDPESVGATWIFHFAPGPVLARVEGPLDDVGLATPPSGLGGVGVGDLDGDGKLETVGRPH
jgi:hypothetical protein